MRSIKWSDADFFEKFKMLQLWRASCTIRGQRQKAEAIPWISFRISTRGSAKTDVKEIVAHRRKTSEIRNRRKENGNGTLADLVLQSMRVEGNHRFRISSMSKLLTNEIIFICCYFQTMCRIFHGSTSIRLGITILRKWQTLYLRETLWGSGISRLNLVHMPVSGCRCHR